MAREAAVVATVPPPETTLQPSASAFPVPVPPVQTTGSWATAAADSVCADQSPGQFRGRRMHQGRLLGACTMAGQ